MPGVIDEDRLFEILDGARRVVLLEPPYSRQYMPLGLARIATYLNGRGTPWEYLRAYSGEEADVVMMATVFTYNFGECIGAIHRVRHYAPGMPIVVGGVAATLMHGKFVAQGVDVFRGYPKRLDVLTPAYESADWETERFADCAHVFTSRGCPNRCKYCAVHRIEPEMWINPSWREQCLTHHPRVVVEDNNFSALPRRHIAEVVSVLSDRRVGVILEGGVDCKHVDDELASMLSRVRWHNEGLRMAFDRIEEDGTFQMAVRRLIDAGTAPSHITGYILFGFTDTPAEALYRASECRKLRIRAYPQQFTPLKSTHRRQPYLGKHWTPQLAKAFRYFWIYKGALVGYGDGDIDDFERWALDRWPGSMYALGEEDLACLRRSMDDWKRNRSS